MRRNRSIRLVPDDIGTPNPVDQKALLTLTIDYLREWEILGGECSACKRQGSVNEYQVRKDFGIRPLAELQQYLHCTVCDNKGDNRLIISKMVRDCAASV